MSSAEQLANGNGNIWVIGLPGSGKTTLARQLATLTGKRHIDLDDLQWLPNWVERDREAFLSLIQREVTVEGWVISGNSSRARFLIWPHATAIVWLDKPLLHCVLRTLQRSFKRCWSRELCCNGNLETWRQLFSNKSILYWLFRSYLHRKKNYSDFFSAVDNSPYKVRLCNDRDVTAFLGLLSIEFFPKEL